MRKFITAKEFNKEHKNDFFKLITEKDSVAWGDLYEAYIEIDPAKVKDVSKISIISRGHQNNQAWTGKEFERRKSKFKLRFAHYYLEDNKTEILIINKNGSKPDTIKFFLNIYSYRPKEFTNINEIGYADPMPKFVSKDYANFKLYISANCKAIGLNLKGELKFHYVVMTNGSVKCEGISKSNLDYDEESKLMKIIEKCKGWIPGIYEGKKRNVGTLEIFVF